MFDTFINISSTNQLGIAFNGGKDCTVLLHLISKCFSDFKKENSSFENVPNDSLPIKTLYFDLPETFQEVIDFTHSAAKR